MSTHWLKYRGTRFPVRRGETVVGRSAYCSIVLSNPLASRQHCALKLSGNSLTISDLGSSNGTYVNGVRVEQARPLEPGDMIRVGTDLLEVILSDHDGRAGTIAERKRLDTHPEDLRAEEEPEPSTETKSTLDLIEALAANAAETRRPAAMAGSLQHLVESLLDNQELPSRPLSTADKTRLSAVVEKVASWDESLTDWRERTIRKLTQ